MRYARQVLHAPILGVGAPRKWWARRAIDGARGQFLEARVARGSVGSTWTAFDGLLALFGPMMDFFAARPV